MRKLILRMNCSLDGFVSGPDGENSWIFPDYDADASAWAADALWRAGAHLMGSVTYREMAAHWPQSTEVFAPPMNRIPKLVFSSTLKEASWPETRIVSGALASEIALLKAAPGRRAARARRCAFRSVLDQAAVGRRIPLVRASGSARARQVAVLDPGATPPTQNSQSRDLQHGPRARDVAEHLTRQALPKLLARARAW